VIFKNEPLPAGKVVFLGQEGSKQVFSAWIAADGRYEMEGVPVGPVTITVTTYKLSVKVAAPPGLGPMRPPEPEELPAPPPGKYVAIPPRYSKPDQSNLTSTVRAGDQEHDIVLEP
jgi:hypothetical protein